jgi:adenine-specific DNA methylase
MIEKFTASSSDCTASPRLRVSVSSYEVSASSLDAPRLIEVAFPLEQASVASVHEKNVRHGHISTLHIWPARRPLAACRAALLATLLPDPGDPIKRQELLEKIGGRVVTKPVKTTDENGTTYTEDKKVVEGGVLAWGQENDPAMDEFRAMIKEFYGDKAPKVLDPFAGGGAIPLEAMRLGCDVTASDINPVAWLILKCTLDYPQQFAGKKWPLPDFVRDWPNFVEDFIGGKVKKRKGSKKPHFSDLKQLQLMKLPDADLAWHVRAWGRWVLERARADLSARYPVVGGEPTVAYLWARTARDKITTGRIPLLKTFWLCKKKGKRVALLPNPKEDGSGVTFKLLNDSDLNNAQRVIDEFPFLKKWEVTADKFGDFLNHGTMNRAGVWSPCSGRPGLIALTMDDLRRQGQQGLLGTQMTAVVVEATMPNGKKTFKKYRLPTEEELKAAQVEIEDLEEVFSDIPYGIPDEPMPPVGTLGFRVPLYGFKKWRDLFTPRQLLALGTFVSHIRRAIKELKISDAKHAESIAAYLVLAFDRMVDFENVNVQWKLDAECINHSLVRYALQITWDFGEPSSISEYSGAFGVCCERICEALQEIKINAVTKRDILSKSAISVVAENLDLYFTDPPYYNAIPYSDLSDLFLIWVKRITHGLSDEYSGAIPTGLAPKWDAAANDGELIDDESRFGGDKKKSKANYENGMARAFQIASDSLSVDGRMIIVFANKEVDAWETLIGALIRGGAIVTASWPIQTEQPSRMRGMSSAALSSSVWIVCRKRPDAAVAGWDANVLNRMKQILFDPREVLGKRNILQYFFDLGIKGPDFIWAALGPALEAYSAHPFVKKQEGGVMTVPEFLKEVRKLVLQFSLGELPGFRDVQKDTQGRGEAIELDAVTQYYLLHRAYFGLEPAPAGACILYANACGKNETELKLVWNIIEQGGKSKRGRPTKEESEGMEEEVGESKGNEYRLLDWSERAKDDRLGEARAGGPTPLIDRLHRLMALFQQNRTYDVQQAFDSWGLSGERAFSPLLQAIRELAVRDGKDTERRLVEALATQLKMNRKVIISGNVVREAPLFEYIPERNGGK